MKKMLQTLIILILMLVLVGCNIGNTNNEDYIDIKKLYNENKEVINKVITQMDLKTYSEKFNREDYSYEIRLHSRMNFSYFIFSETDNIKYNYKRVMFYKPDIYQVIMYEMKSEQEAKETFEKCILSNSINPVFYEKNIIYFDTVIFNLMMKRYYTEGNNYITLDGETFLTNLSNEEIIYISNAKEIAELSCELHTNIKKVYTDDNLEKINYAAFNCCYNLENVYFNNGLKEIAYHAFFGCESLKYVVIPKSVEKIGLEAFSHGAIYCEALEKPEGWDDNFAWGRAKVYWGNEWKYNDDGIPVLNEKIS